MYYLIFRFFAALLLVAVAVRSRPTIKQVSIVHRHGARDGSLFMDGKLVWEFAQLTPNGEIMMRNLGLLLQKEYGAFVSSFDPDFYDVLSGDSDRCIQSAHGVLRAFFNQTLQFVPIVKYGPVESDWLIEFNENFPNVIARSKWFYAYSNNDTLAREKLLEEDIRNLADEFGDWCAKTPMLCSLFAADTIQCRISNGNKISEALLRLFSEKLLSLVYGNNKYTLGFYSTDPYAVTGSPGYTLAAKILRDAQTSAKKFYHYSAHDTTVLGVLNSFGSIQIDDVDHKWLPRFGAVLAVTTYTNGNISFSYAEPEQEAGSSLNYTFGLSPITVRCQTAAGVEYVASVCPVDDVWRYLNRSKPSVANPFCYLTKEDKCDILDALPSPQCQYYRQHCPQDACGSDAVLSVAKNYTCISLSKRNTIGWLIILAIFSCVLCVVIGLFVGVIVASLFPKKKRGEQ